MSAGCNLWLPRLPTKEELLQATLPLLFSASTPQALFVSELRTRYRPSFKEEGMAGEGHVAEPAGTMQVRFVLGGFLGLSLHTRADSPAYSHVEARQESTYRTSKGNGTYFFRTSVDFRPMQPEEARRVVLDPGLKSPYTRTRNAKAQAHLTSIRALPVVGTGLCRECVR